MRAAKIWHRNIGLVTGVRESRLLNVACGCFRAEWSISTPPPHHIHYTRQDPGLGVLHCASPLPAARLWLTMAQALGQLMTLAI